MKQLIRLIPCLLIIWGCRQQAIEPPENPFDQIDYGVHEVEIPAPDSSTLVGLHQYIFAASCAVPGCHDGAFEPDFRTVQSTYSTLVYQPVVKNTTDEAFEMRVKPFDPAASWLYYRVTTDDSLLGRMPLYDHPLTKGQLQAMKSWIEAGAPDLLGNVSALPNTQPIVRGVAAQMQYQFNWIRVDSFRNNPYDPFGLFQNSQFVVWAELEDDTTPPENLSNIQMELGSGYLQIRDWNPNQTVSGVYDPNGWVIPDFHGPGLPGVFHWKFTMNSGDFPAGQVTFFRIQGNDGTNPDPFEFPRDGHPDAYKSYMAFYVIP
ncbi:hypothetical protein [Pontibacter sp. G13]|uniref:hypothetical protein n=1 Tax=Pontibacter sp. G13 TaxID=3074898 RepID=UPI00288C41C4|nr:hypothetical protein [Pontibacter sp. G13]WNJ17789.1 hypothetical protein RJD25_23300 [Pontibacter sp. G13]